MKNQSLNAITILFLTISGFVSIFGQQKGGEIINGESPESGQTYAVVVGISDYQDELIPDLHYADRDAMAFADFLRSPSGGELDADHLKLLLNEDATHARFAIELKWLLEVAEEGDKVIIYFSGHGDVENTTSFQPGYLLCWDAWSQVYMGGGAFGLNTFRGVISSLSLNNKAKVVVITDACRSGKLSGSQIGGSRLTNADLAQQYESEVKILSCQPEEFSIEGEQWGGGRGAFSYHLINGLYGLADEDDDKVVTVMEIRSYLERNIPDEVAPFDQLPITVGNSKESLSIVDPDVLQRVKEIDLGQLEIFGSLATKGMVTEILHESDSSIQKDYEAFEQALEHNQFFHPADDCAEFYYQRLIQEPALKELHSVMSRNYAAALQDDAQQVLRTILKTGLTLTVTMSKKSKDLYAEYPHYIERALELLGEDHYMYNLLLARKYYFEGLMAGPAENRRRYYQKAIRANPDFVMAYTAAITTYKAENLDSAMMYFEKARNLVPNWVKPYTQIAYFHRSKLKDLAKAREFLMDAEKIDSQSVYLNYRIAQYYQSQKNYIQAEKYFLKAINGKSSDVCFPCLHTQLGHMYTRKLNNSEAAIEQYTLSVEGEDDPAFCFPCGYINLANLYSSLDQRDKQREAIMNALRIDPYYDVGYANLAGLEEFEKNYEAAKLNLLKALRYHKDAPLEELNAILADIYSKLGQPDSAKIYLDKTIQLSPSSAKTHRLIARYYSKQNKPELTIQYALECIRKDSTSIECYEYLKNAYFRTKQYDEAIKYALFLISNDSTEITNYVDAGAAFMNSGDHENAMLYFNKALEIDSTHSVLQGNLAVTKQILGDDQGFEKHMLLSIKYNENNRTSKIRLANYYRDNGRFVDAAVYYKKVYQENKKDNYAGMQLGIIYNRLKRYGEAEQIFRQLIENKSDYGLAYTNLAVVCSNQGKVDEAEAMFKKALTLMPKHVFSLQRLGQLYRSQGKFERTREMYARVVNAAPGNAQHLNNLGDIYFILGNFNKAEQVLDKAIKADTSYWLAYLTNAQILQGKQEWESSLVSINKALKLYPDYAGNYALRALACAHLNIKPDQVKSDIEVAKSQGSESYDVCLYIAQYFAFKGEKEKAFTYLEKMYEQANGQLYIKVFLDREPDFDVLRQEERWKNLMNKYYPD